MPLVERLMGDLGEPKIPVHDFFAANAQRIAAQLTRQQVIDMFSMTAADIVEYDLLAALAPGAQVGQALFIEKIHAIFILAEGRYPGYDTPAQVRLKLGI